MLVSAYFSLKSEDRLYVFNPENVLYIDFEGVLFTKDVYRQFTEGEYTHVLEQLGKLIPKGYKLDFCNIEPIQKLDNVKV